MGSTELLWRKVNSNTMQRPQDVVYKRFLLPGLLHDEMSSTFLCDLDERITGHVLHTYTAIDASLTSIH